MAKAARAATTWAREFPAAVWLARRVGLRRNSLRRGSDRIEGWTLLLLVLVFLASIPLAGLAGITVSEHRAATAARLAQTEHHVIAVAQRGTPIGPAAGEPGAEQLRPTVPVRWIGADGRPHTVDTVVDFGTAAGGPVPIWVDRNDRLAEAPPRGVDVIGAGVASAVSVLLGAAGLLVIAGLMVRRFLDARRMRAWDREWTVVAHRWSAR